MGIGHSNSLSASRDEDHVTVPVTRTTLSHCREVVGALSRMEERDGELRVIVHDRLLAYPVGSDESRTLRDSLDGVPLGTRVGILCLALDGRRRLFVRIAVEGEA